MSRRTGTIQFLDQASVEGLGGFADSFVSSLFSSVIAHLFTGMMHQSFLLSFHIIYLHSTSIWGKCQGFCTCIQSFLVYPVYSGMRAGLRPARTEEGVLAWPRPRQ